MPPRQWGSTEWSVFLHGGIAAAAGLVVAYGPEIMGMDWGKWSPLVVVVVGGIVSWAKLFLSNNSEPHK